MIAPFAALARIMGCQLPNIFANESRLLSDRTKRIDTVRAID